MYQPAIPLSGYGGWKFLQATYDRQLQGFSDSAAVKNDRDYLEKKLSQPMAMEDFLSDKRLLRVSMTAFDLEGEEWKVGFVRRVMEENAKPESTFLARLNKPDYTRFAKAFPLTDGKISLSAEAVAQIGDQFESAAFRSSVGEVDNNMRLSLNYKNKIAEITGSGSSEKAMLYRILGNVPVRTVLESALNLPSEMRKLDLDQQADILKEKLQSVFSISDITKLGEEQLVEKAIQRFHAIEAIKQGPSPTAPGAAALQLLNGAAGFGSLASQNLFLSRF